MTQQTKPSKPVVTSHSIGTTFESCPRRFEFAHVYGVQGRGRINYAADVGTALHEAIQGWARIYLAPDAERNDTTKQLALDAGVYELLKWFPWVEEELELEAGKPSAQQRSFNRALALYFSACESKWWDDWELALDDKGEPIIERAYRIEYQSLPKFTDHNGVERYIVQQGKIDFGLAHRKTGEIRVGDIKTTNKHPSKFEASWRFSGQGAGYGIVLGAAAGYNWRDHGLNVTYLVCHFPGVNDEMGPVIPLTFFYSPEEIEDKIMTDRDQHLRMIHYGERGWWPRKTSGCESWGSVCPFFDVCHRRDHSFIDKWLASSDDHEEKDRVYDAGWSFIA